MAKTRSGVDLPLPPAGLRLHADDDERFVRESAHLASVCYRLGLRDGDEVVDVGCGVGRLAIGLLADTGFHGRYVGFDVMKRHVGWARRHLRPVATGFHFRHADVRNDRYNPTGTIEPRDFRFPVRSDGFHFATLFSIFTHFYADDIEIYLRELRRVLRPGGHALTTWLLHDDSTLDSAKTTSAYPMHHRLDETTIFNDAEDPLRAISFHESRARALIEASGLELVTIERGKWNGGPGPEFQDVVLLRRPPLTAAQRAVRKARGLAGRLRRRSA